jgi:hypothetical protein
MGLPNNPDRCKQSGLSLLDPLRTRIILIRNLENAFGDDEVKNPLAPDLFRIVRF